MGLVGPVALSAWRPSTSRCGGFRRVIPHGPPPYSLAVEQAERQEVEPRRQRLCEAEPPSELHRVEEARPPRLRVLHGSRALRLPNETHGGREGATADGYRTAPQAGHEQRAPPLVVLEHKCVRQRGQQIRLQPAVHLLGYEPAVAVL